MNQNKSPSFCALLVLFFTLEFLESTHYFLTSHSLSILSTHWLLSTSPLKLVLQITLWLEDCILLLPLHPQDLKTLLSSLVHLFSKMLLNMPYSHPNQILTLIAGLLVLHQSKEIHKFHVNKCDLRVAGLKSDESERK